MTTIAFFSNKVAIDGCEVYYEKRGSGSCVLLLIPGALGSTATHFGHQHSGFDRDKFTLISLDLPGYGQSRPFHRTFQRHYWTDAETCKKLMETLGYSKYSIVGFSDGGRVGLIMAANYPERITKVVGWGCSAYVTSKEKDFLNSIRDSNSWNMSLREAMKAVYGTEELKTLWNRFVDSYTSYDDIFRRDVPKITCPVFILYGDKDPIIAPEHVNYFEKTLLNVQVQHFPLGRHDFHHKFHKEFNESVQKFLLN